MLISNFLFWLTTVSLVCLILERLFPWRPQKLVREGFRQDLFWIVFNGHTFSYITAGLFLWIANHLSMVFYQLGAKPPESWKLLSEWPLWAQFFIFLVFQDFLEWCIHNLLHRVPILWRFHQLHHSIITMDWLGNMRFHWMEIIVYKSLKYIPLIMLGVHWQVILGVAVTSLTIGSLNHSNLNWGYGPLRYIISSPRYHLWHHDMECHYKNGQNFAIVFSLWDYLFKTAWYIPGKHAKQLGFKGIETFPKTLLPRLVSGFSTNRSR
ncbi:MAG: sterol desaturase family protein [Fibrobacteria bacterium]|nr:sterol desaturase family protein [Fibrobacteria bacterium]